MIRISIFLGILIGAIAVSDETLKLQPFNYLPEICTRDKNGCYIIPILLDKNQSKEFAEMERRIIDKPSLRLILADDFLFLKKCNNEIKIYELPAMKLTGQRHSIFQLQADLLDNIDSRIWDNHLSDCIHKWNQSSWYLNCSRHGINSLHVQIEPSYPDTYERITVADLSSNNITYLERRHSIFFLLFPNLVSLDLTRNSIRTVDPNSFVLANNLRFLHLESATVGQNISKIFELNRDLQLIENKYFRTATIYFNKCKEMQVKSKNESNKIVIDPPIKIDEKCRLSDDNSTKCVAELPPQHNFFVFDDHPGQRIHKLNVSNPANASLTIRTPINIVYFGNCILIRNCKKNAYDLFNRTNYWSLLALIQPKKTERSTEPAAPYDIALHNCYNGSISKTHVSCTRKSIQKMILANHTSIDLVYLRSLKLSENHITRLDKATIQNFPALIELNLERNPITLIITDAFAKAVPQLRLLNLRGTQLLHLNCLLASNDYLQVIKHGWSEFMYRSCDERYEMCANQTIVSNELIVHSVDDSDTSHDSQTPTYLIVAENSLSGLHRSAQESATEVLTLATRPTTSTKTAATTTMAVSETTPATKPPTASKLEKNPDKEKREVPEKSSSIRTYKILVIFVLIVLLGMVLGCRQKVF